MRWALPWIRAVRKNTTRRSRQVSAPASRQRRSGKVSRKFLFIATAAIATGLMIPKGVHYAAEWYRARNVEKVYQEDVRKIIELKKNGWQPPGEKGFPREAIHYPPEIIPKEGDWCSFYARMVAFDMYGMVYKRGDAWELAERNRSVWKYPGKWDPFTGKPTFEFLTKAKPGYLLGIYFPHAREVPVAFTHVMTYVGSINGEPYAMDRVGTAERIHPLRQYLAELSKPSNENPSGKKGAVLEVIAPLEE